MVLWDEPSSLQALEGREHIHVAAVTNSHERRGAAHHKFYDETFDTLKRKCPFLPVRNEFELTSTRPVFTQHSAVG